MYIRRGLKVFRVESCQKLTPCVSVVILKRLKKVMV